VIDLHHLEPRGPQPTSRPTPAIAGLAAFLLLSGAAVAADVSATRAGARAAIDDARELEVRAHYPGSPRTSYGLAERFPGPRYA
jgi:hypothetical protein